MEQNRIAGSLEPFVDGRLAPGQLEQVSIYIDLLLRWNSRVNLTAIRKPEEIVPRHFGESLFLARHLFPAGPKLGSDFVQTEQPPEVVQSGAARFPTGGERTVHVVDIGSGAGFPALPVKIYAPEIRLTMIESNHKKAAFLREVARALSLRDVEVMTERAETLLGTMTGPPRTGMAAAQGHEVTDSHYRAAGVVTLRAVESFDKVLAVAARFRAPEGRMALLIGNSQLPATQALPELMWQTYPIPNSKSRILAIGVHK